MKVKQGELLGEMFKDDFSADRGTYHIYKQTIRILWWKFEIVDTIKDSVIVNREINGI